VSLLLLAPNLFNITKPPLPVTVSKNVRREEGRTPRNGALRQNNCAPQETQLWLEHRSLRPRSRRSESLRRRLQRRHYQSTRRIGRRNSRRYDRKPSRLR